MSKIKLNTKREEVSSEEIKSRRDFNQLLKEYKASPQTASKPFYKNIYFVAGATTLVATGIFALIYFNNENKNNTISDLSKEDSTENINQPFIAVPFKNIEIPFENFSIIAEKGGVLKTKSGSIIKIPADAFAWGELLSGEIDIQYREFRDPIDILVSGIPMKYDSSGIAMQLESGGMFEIQASQNGKPVGLYKTITVEMTSKKIPGDFNQYYLDTVSRAWKYLGKDKLITSNNVNLTSESNSDTALYELPSELPDPDGFGEDDPLEIYDGQAKSLKELTNALKKEEPVKPIKAKSQNYSFDLDVLPNEFPELVDYKGLKFEVVPENKTFNEKMYSIEWDDVVLNYNTPGKNYKISFIKDSKKSDFIVYPVYQGKDSAKVIALYQKKYKVYEQKLNERLTEEKELQAYKVKELKRREEETRKQEEEWAKQEALQKKSDKEFMQSKAELNHQNIVRLFSVEKLGIYNCDFASFYTNRVVLKASFFNEGKDINPLVVYMLDADKNTVFMQYSRFDNFFYSPTSKHTLLAIFPDNKLAVFSSEDFKNVKKVNGKYTFNMKKENKEFGMVEELKDYLLPKKNQ